MPKFVYEYFHISYSKIVNPSHKENGGLAESNPIAEIEAIIINKSELSFAKGEGVISVNMHDHTVASFPQGIYEKINSINSTFVWNENIDFEVNEEIVLGYQVLNQDKKFVFSEDYYSNPELLKDYDGVMITLKLIK